MKRWMRLAVVVGASLIAVAVMGLYTVSDIMMQRRDHPALPTIHASTGPTAVARGERLARLYGCTGCHADTLQGQEWQTDFLTGRLYTANLTRAMPHYSDAELARAIREGVKPDGSALWGMPSESWIATTDAEMADLLAWLRTHPPKGESTPTPTLGPLSRLKLVLGHMKSSHGYVVESRALPSFDAGPQFARGRHLAATVCSECHRSNLKGDPGWTPDLTIAAAYDRPLFIRLMRTGIGMDGKEHGLMTEVSRDRLVHFTDQEIAELHAYLTARAERMP